MRFIENRRAILLVCLLLLHWVSADILKGDPPSDEKGVHEQLASFFPPSSPFTGTGNRDRLNSRKLSRKMETAHMEKYRAFVKRTEKMIVIVKIPSRSSESAHQEVLAFWQFGEQLVVEKKQQKDNKAYAVFLTNQLSTELSMDKTTLSEIENLYLSYPEMSGLETALSFDHYRVLMDVPDKVERLNFQRQAVEKKWSPQELEDRVRRKSIERKTKEWFRGRYVT